MKKDKAVVGKVEARRHNVEIRTNQTLRTASRCDQSALQDPRETINSCHVVFSRVAIGRMEKVPFLPKRGDLVRGTRFGRCIRVPIRIVLWGFLSRPARFTRHEFLPRRRCRRNSIISSASAEVTDLALTLTIIGCYSYRSYRPFAASICANRGS